MADALLARLANGHANPTIELSSAPPVAIPQQVPPQALPQNPAPMMPDLRPSSVQRSETFFGKEGQNQLLDYHRRASAQSVVLRQAAARANRMRHALTLVMVISGVASSVLSGAPICSEPGSPDAACTKTVANFACALSALSVAVMGLLEKTSSRKDSVRLRDLGSDYSKLAALLDRRLFTSPPDHSTATGFIKTVGAAFEALEQRHSNLRPKPEEVKAATINYDRTLATHRAFV